MSAAMADFPERSRTPDEDREMADAIARGRAARDAMNAAMSDAIRGEVGEVDTAAGIVRIGGACFDPGRVCRLLDVHGAGHFEVVVEWVAGPDDFTAD